MCGKVSARLIVFKVLGTFGKSSPNMLGQFPAAIGRVVSSVFNVDELRCEICVDDPSWPLEEALKRGHAPSQLRCWPSSWVSLRLGRSQRVLRHYHHSKTRIATSVMSAIFTRKRR